MIEGWIAVVLCVGIPLVIAIVIGVTYNRHCRTQFRLIAELLWRDIEKNSKQEKFK